MKSLDGTVFTTLPIPSWNTAGGGLADIEKTKTGVDCQEDQSSEQQEVQLSASGWRVIAASSKLLFIVMVVALLLSSINALARSVPRRGDSSKEDC